MYEELVDRLRNLSRFEIRNAESVIHVSAEAVTELREIAQEAADAIEELNGYLAEAERDRDEYRERLDKTNDMVGKRWIPVTERLPEDGQDILAIQSYADEVRIVPANYDRGVWYDCVFNRVATHITHWMSLPELPKEET